MQLAAVTLMPTLTGLTWLTKTYLVSVQPALSVTVQLYAPSGTLLMADVVALLLHWYKNGGFEPLTLMAAEPVVPGQSALTTVAWPFIVLAAGIGTTPVRTQPALSV